MKHRNIFGRLEYKKGAFFVEKKPDVNARYYILKNETWYKRRAAMFPLFDVRFLKSWARLLFRSRSFVVLSCTLTIKYMPILARFVFRCSVSMLAACFLVLGAFLRLLVAFDAAAGLPDAIGADLVRVFRSAGLFLFPVSDVLQVSRILCAVPDPLRYIVLLY